MTDGNRSRSSSLPLIVGVALLLAISILLGIELLQRHRFTTLDRELDAAVATFIAQARLAVTGDEQVIIAAPGAPGYAQLSSRRSSADYWSSHERLWYLQADLGPTPGRLPVRIAVTLTQERAFLLKKPVVRVSVLDTFGKSLEVLLNQTFLSFEAAPSK